MSVFLKCICTSCDQPIEFPAEMASQTIDCPGCNTLLLLPQQEPDKKGFFQNLIQKYKDAKQDAANSKEFKRELISAVSDGVLTDAELQELTHLRETFGLTDADINNWGLEIFHAAFQGAKVRGHISQHAEANLIVIQRYLHLPDSEVAEIKAQITRSRMLYDIQNGLLPPILVTNIILTKGEIAYWAEPAALFEEKVVGRSYQGGSSGVSFRVMKGVSFRVGAHRGQMVSQTAHVPVSNGLLVITNRRIIFQGDNKSFATKLDKLIDLNPHLDGLRFSESGRQKPRLISLPNQNGDIVCEVLSHVLSNFSK